MSDHKTVVSPLALGLANSLAILIVIVIAGGAYRSQSSAMADLQHSLDTITQRLASQPAPDVVPSQQTSNAAGGRIADRAGNAMAGGQQSSGAGAARAAGTATQQASVLEGAYARDARDVSGALVSTRLDAVARQPELLSSGVAPEIVHTDCRARSCRIVAQFKNASSAQDWPVLYATSAAATLSGTRIVTLPQADGSVEVRIFGIRR